MTAYPLPRYPRGANQPRSEAMANLRITGHEISSCADSAQIVGVAGFLESPLCVLKFVYDTGDSQILCLDGSAIRHLVAVLKSLVPGFSAIDALPVLVDIETGAASAWSPL